MVWNCSISLSVYNFFMDYEVYVWTFVPFEYDPFIATLFTLLSAHFIYSYLSFDLRYSYTIQSALTFAMFVPNCQFIIPTFLCSYSTYFKIPTLLTIVISSRPLTLGWCKWYWFSVKLFLYTVAVNNCNLPLYTYH